MPLAPNEPNRVLQQFLQAQGLALHEHDELPKSKDEWTARKQQIRENLQKSWGPFPKEKCDLEPETLGVIERDGYRIEKVVLQTRPGIHMTANAYVPAGSGKRAAVLCVHGHWKGAKQDPVVQSRCIGLAKLGFFVLVVDAFGAGERGLGKALGEYHGETVASTLWPTGLTLAGLQVYDNMRAVDYLQSRPEVDPERLGITGASGGGNQTMYAGAFDERFKCVVPTCSVGTYQAYLHAACCMCEMVPNAMAYTEEWGILSLVAPRGLMVTSATMDAYQFSVDEAKKSVAAAKQVFKLFGKENNVAHTIVESPHAYNQPMREAMYGWMTLHLKGEGDGSPIPEPEIAPEEPEVLRCYPGESRPASFITLPQFAADVGKSILNHKRLPQHPEEWDAQRLMKLQALSHGLLGSFPEATKLELEVSATDDDHIQRIEFETEPGLRLQAHYRIPGDAPVERAAIILNQDGAAAGATSEWASLLVENGWGVLAVSLRGTGETAVAGDQIGRAPDHNSWEWSTWIGRPLMGQWIWDIGRAIDALRESGLAGNSEFAMIGHDQTGLVGLTASLFLTQITHVAVVKALSSFISDVPYEGQRLGVIVPRMLTEVGDVSHLAALCAPRPCLIAGGVAGDGAPLSQAALVDHFSVTQRVYEFAEVPENLYIAADLAPADVVRWLKRSV
ncbi:MAG: prolyl oligopeptidase family serine peptidase [Planctomycetota bacterium]|nr:prolyl oligopeptidase family serine peptidase [Planctomycetota bacterium]MDA1214184.1 prolyl oligopeptidase family serine peptidase [Planctomycetota bacterium]